MIKKGRKSKLTIAEIEKAHAEFQAGLDSIQEDLRALVERTIRKIDEKQAEKILNQIKNS